MTAPFAILAERFCKRQAGQSYPIWREPPRMVTRRHNGVTTFIEKTTKNTVPTQLIGRVFPLYFCQKMAENKALAEGGGFEPPVDL
jgi:hypothetical protein